MKKQLLASVALVATALAANAGNILATNFSEDPLRQLPITLNGTAVTTGSVAIGYFANDPTALIAGLQTGGRDALLAAFTQFGSTGAVGGGGLDGLYAGENSSPIADTYAGIGKDIYTIIGDQATLAASTSFAVVKDNQTFAADNPVFEALADISEASSVILYGSASGPGVTTVLGLSQASVALAPIPEPSISLLAASALGLVLNRRRKS